MRVAAAGAALLFAGAPAHAVPPTQERERSRMAPVYDGFSHRVGVRWEGDVVVLTLPEDRAGREREVRVPGWPVPAPEPRPAPMGFVGVGYDGSPLFNGRPEGLPQPRLKEGASLAPMRGPGGASLDGRPDLSALVGILLDGFPLYGPVERDGSTASGLDRCGGHLGLTPNHERPVYHYHVDPVRPTVCGCLRGLEARADAEGRH